MAAVAAGPAAPGALLDSCRGGVSSLLLLLASLRLLMTLAALSGGSLLAGIWLRWGRPPWLRLASTWVLAGAA